MPERVLDELLAEDALASCGYHHIASTYISFGPGLLRPEIAIFDSKPPRPDRAITSLIPVPSSRCSARDTNTRTEMPLSSTRRLVCSISSWLIRGRRRRYGTSAAKLPSSSIAPQ